VEGNQQNYGMRIYDPRLGKFLSADPLIVYMGKYPELSSYQFASNTPIQAIDLDGLEAKVIIHYYKKINGNQKSMTKTVTWRDFSGTSQYNGPKGLGNLYVYRLEEDGETIGEVYEELHVIFDFFELAERLEEKIDLFNRNPIRVDEPGSPSQSSKTPTGELDGNTNPLFSDKAEGTGMNGDSFLDPIINFFKKDEKTEDFNNLNVGDTFKMNGKSGSRFEGFKLYYKKTGEKEREQINQPENDNYFPTTKN